MRTLSWMTAAFVMFVSGGATCFQRYPAVQYPPPPPVRTETPTLQEITSVVNRTASITKLSSNSTVVDVLSMPGLPQLSASLSLERPKNFRLQASLMVGSGLDMGSNDQAFWFEVPEGMTRVLYYAEHEKYRQQLQRAILPVDPTWIMDALGLAQIDPTTVVAGPVRRPDGKLEIRTAVTMPGGVYQRVYFVNSSAGFISEQFLYAPGGNLIATSQATNHRYYEELQCALPHQVTLNLTPANGPPLAMQIVVGSYAVNQLLSGDPQLFTMPQSAGKAVDLTTISAVPLSSVNVAPTTYTADAPTPTPLRGLFR